MDVGHIVHQRTAVVQRHRQAVVIGQLGNVGAALQYLIIKVETLLQRLIAAVAVILYSMQSILQGIIGVKRDDGLHKLIASLRSLPNF